MSRLQEFTDQIKMKASEVFEKIKETEIYQKLSDRYESLAPAGQKTVRIVLVILGLFIVLFFPISQIATSKEFITGFEDKRQLIRDLFRTYRESSQASRLMPAPSSDSLIGSVNTTLQNEQLLPEQIISVAVGAVEGRLIPANLMTDVIDVKLSKLNLRQIVDIGTRLSNISQSVKLKDLLMSLNPEVANYFDVTYKLYSLNVPAAPVELPQEPETKPKKKKSDDGKDDIDKKSKAEDE
jgi:hypothetical protein